MTKRKSGKPLDYRSFVPEEEAKARAKAEMDGPDGGYWWDEKPERRHTAVTEALTAIAADQGARVAANTKFIRMYGDAAYLREADTAADVPRAASRVRQALMTPQEKLAYNVCRVCVGTAQARIAKQRPKITALPQGGGATSWKMQQQSKRLDKFLQGAFYTSKAPQKGRDAFRDGCVTDVGVLKVYREGKRICVERVLPGELYVDKMDGLYGEPRTIYQVKAVPKEVLISRVRRDKGLSEDKRRKLLEAIRTAQQPTKLAAAGLMAPFNRLSDYAMVTMAWHLPSSDDAKDGLYCMTLDTGVLYEEKWTRKRLPFVFFRWEKRVAGFWGTGLVEQLAGDQVFINKTLQTIARILHLCSVPRTWVPVSAGVPKEHFTNQVGTVLFYNGPNPPVTVAPNSVPPELFSALESAIQRAHSKIGMSQLSSSGMKPAGLDSGAALREQQDIESDRFAIQAQDYEQMYLDLAEVMVDEAEAASEEGVSIEVDIPSGTGMVEKMSWKDVDMDRDAFVLQLFPTSSLPQTPAARKQTILEWQQAGWIDATEARRLMDIPDLDASNSLALAASDDIDATIQDLLDGKDYKPPEPMQDLDLGMRRAQQWYLRAKRLGAPEGVLLNLDRFWNDCKSLLDKAKAAAAALQAAQAVPADGAALPPGNAPPMVPPNPQAGGMQVAA
jgi:hypothetical protein